MKPKFTRVYHFLEAQWALEDLQKKLKASIFDQVNDQRELRAYSLGCVPKENQERALADFVERFCILCFARDSTAEHMWDRYGDQGRGICLGFDIRTNMLVDVQYVPELLIREFPPQLLSALLRHKLKLLAT